MKPKILFYALSKIHLQNMSILEEMCPEYEFIILQWKKSTHLYPEQRPEWPHKRIMIEDTNKDPSNLWKHNYAMIIFSIAYPNPLFLRIIHEAMQRHIPTVAIEEVNQLTLNSGIINHYTTPLDFLGICSDHELALFLEQGYDKNMLRNTGWPFYQSKEKRPDKAKQRHIRKQLGLSQDLPTILLTLSPPRHLDRTSLETIELQTQLIKFVTDALPEKAQLVIKGHPCTNANFIKNFTKKHSPKAHVITGEDVSISTALSACDVCINRGTSMTLFEAMNWKIPIVVIPFGLNTVFTQDLPDVIFDCPEKLRNYLENIPATSDYKDFLAIHAPHKIKESLDRTASFLKYALKHKLEKYSNRKMINLILQMAYFHKTKKALSITRESNLRVDAKKALERLILSKASLDNLKLIVSLEGGLIAEQHAIALYIRQLQTQNSATDKDLSLCLRLQKDRNPHYFFNEHLALGKLIKQAANKEDYKRTLKWIHKEYGYLPEVQKLCA